jgi:Domain of unknown function (DUF4402)
MGWCRSLVCLGIIAANATVAVSAQTGCRLCAPETGPVENTPPDVPLRIDVETALDFSRVAQNGDGGGDVAVDARSGGRRVAGGLVDLGGMALRGTVRLTGSPRRMVRIELPNQVQLRSSTGAIADVYTLETDLPPNPALGSDGSLTFSFGGKLSVKGQTSGVFRGSIPITADYQ